MKKTKSYEDYCEKISVWHDEVDRLREILLTTTLEETIKWGIPCYTYKNKNIVGLVSFKTYFGLWFYQGVYLLDKQNVLINAQEGKTQELRQWRMTHANQIRPRFIKQYINEAINRSDNC